MVMEILLLVEDEDIVRQAIVRELTRVGYQVDDVNSGEEALDRLQDREYDLLMVDLVLPGIDGLEFLRERGELNHTAGALIITSYGTTGNAVESMHAGAQGFLMKPFSSGQLIQAVQNVLAMRRLERETWHLSAYQPLIEISRQIHNQAGLG